LNHEANLPSGLIHPLFIDVGDATEKTAGFRVTLINHAVGLHGGDKDEIIGPQDFLIDDLIRFDIVLADPDLARQDIHGLIIEMIVNGNFSLGPHPEIPQAIFRRPIGTRLGKPADNGVFYLVGLSFVRVTLNLLVLIIIDILYVHENLLFELAAGDERSALREADA
jgi:hypothetical protein